MTNREITSQIVKSLFLKRKFQQGGNISYTPYIPKKTVDPEYVKIEEQIPTGYVKQYNLETPIQIISEIPEEQETSQEPEVKDIVLENIPGVQMDNLNAIQKRLTDSGFTSKQRAAILATVALESGANPSAIGDNGLASGLFQWHPNRFNGKFDLDSQIDLIVSEIRDKQNGNGWTGSSIFSKDNALSAFDGDDLYAIVSALTANFIRPANTQREIQRRYDLAQKIYKQLC